MDKRSTSKRRRTAKYKWPAGAFALLLFLCVLFVLCSHAWAAEDFDFSYDMRSMIQRNPDFSTYSGPDGRGPDGVIWLKRIYCGIAPEGGVERQTMWILLGRRGLPAKWLSWNIPVPKGGKAEILEASMHSPGEGTKIGTAVLTAGDDPGAVRSVTFSDPPDDFILVVHYREVFPDKLSVDDLVWTSESLPVWETVIRVTVPAGHPFYHFSSQNHAPQERKIDDRMEYEWLVLNTSAEIHPSIRVETRDYVAFGSRNDRSAAARFIRALEGIRLPPPPTAVRNLLGKRQGAKEVENLLSWIYKQPGILLTYESRELPAEAPWTTREKTLLAHSWLKEAGVNVRLFWRLPYDPSGKPVCEAAIVEPVIEILLPDLKKGAFYCDMERLPRLGKNEAMRGGILYGLVQGASDSLEERKPPTTSASENRLSSSFILSLSEDGVLTGTVNIAARSAWRHFLFPGNPTDDDLAEWMRGMFTQVPRYSDVTFRESGTESVVTATLSGIQGIKGTGGNHIMAASLSLVPQWFKSLSSGPFPYKLNFPFVIDAKVELTLPASTANVLLPSPVSHSAGKIKYSESYKIDKRKKLLAEVRMAVETTSISDDEAAYLAAALQSWRTFMTQYLPVQLKAR